MRRQGILSLACVGWFALSCSVFGPQSAELPAVSAGPGGAVAAAPVRDGEIAEIVAALGRRATGLTPAEVEGVAQTVVAEARRHALEPSLVLAVMHVESRFYNFAVSPVGAMGLMQVMPDTGAELAARMGIRWLGPQTLFDPTTNIRLGVAYLRELSDRYGNVKIALAAYNWGPGRIDRRLRMGTELPAEYPTLVLEAYAEGRGRS
jgi:soluble lytic murein transglycosylase-like protein